MGTPRPSHHAPNRWTSRTRRRRTIDAGAVILAATSGFVAVAGIPNLAAADPTQPAGKFTIITSRPTPTARTDAQNTALRQASTFVVNHPSSYGTPYLTQAGKLVVPTADSKAELALRSSYASRGNLGSVPATPVLKLSHAEGLAIQDGIAASRESGSPGYRDIFYIGEDAAASKILIGTRTAPPALLSDLRSRYGTSRITVWLSPGYQTMRPAARYDDKSPYWGGAAISTPIGGRCTSGFSWKINQYTYMVTAGHCARDGGTFRSFRNSGDRNSWPFLGTVTSGGRENWQSGRGTVALVGGTRYLGGDLALINTNNSGGSAATIYVGGSTSGRYVKVARADFTFIGDNMCTGGSTTGEMCGWVVTDVNLAQPLPGSEREGDYYLRRASLAEKPGRCIEGGDSGGPVYYLAQGKNPEARAKGIIHGTGYDPNTRKCVLYFTDIWRVRDSWGGDIMTR